MKSKFIKIIGAITIINILAKLLGFLRDVIIGYQYGTSFFADSIITAYTIPNFIYIVIGGAITTAFISVYSKIEVGRKNAFMSQTVSYITVVIGIITILLLVFVNPILNILFSGLQGEQFAVTKRLYMWMAPSTFFLVFSMWLSGILNVNNRFHLSTFSTFLYNLFFLVLALVLTPILSVHSYGFGALIASIIMFVILLWGLRQERLPTIKFDFHFSPEMKRLFSIAIPIMLGGAALQFYVLIQRIFASGLSEGYISALNYASKLTQFPQGVLMTAVTTVIFPLLSKKVASNEMEQVSTVYQKGLRYLGLLMIPATIFVYFYSEQFVSIIFEYGHFTKESSQITVPLLQIFSLSMFTLAGTVYVSRFFYAMENSYLPVLISIVCVFGINILIIILFIQHLGAEAIAWGTSISSMINFILLLLMATYVLKIKLFVKGSKLFWKTTLLNLLLVLIMYASSHFIQFKINWLTFAFGLLILLVSFFVLMVIFKMPEVSLILKKQSKKNV